MVASLDDLDLLVPLPTAPWAPERQWWTARGCCCTCCARLRTIRPRGHHPRVVGRGEHDDADGAPTPVWSSDGGERAHGRVCAFILVRDRPRRQEDDDHVSSFGMSAAPHRVHATFGCSMRRTASPSRAGGCRTGQVWARSRGRDSRLEKQPVAAYEDSRFAWEAKERESATFVAHVRYATTGANNLADTTRRAEGPTVRAQRGDRGPGRSWRRNWGDYRDLVQGDTDSERTSRSSPGTSTRTTATWCRDHGRGRLDRRQPADALDQFRPDRGGTDVGVPLPGHRRLMVLRRRPDGPSGRRHLAHASTAGTVRARSGALATLPAVVVATEPMDEYPDGESLCPGELLHVGPNHEVTRTMIRRATAEPSVDTRGSVLSTPRRRGAERRLTVRPVRRGSRIPQRAGVGQHVAHRGRGVRTPARSGSSSRCNRQRQRRLAEQ